ncbi:MAG: hypothetical protein AB7E81_06910 [Hyphomicrobiaceae bacterium]
MSHDDEDRLKGNIKADKGRAARLAAELRRNLHRRKQRTRAVAARAREDDRAASPLPPDDPSL